LVQEEQQVALLLQRQAGVILPLAALKVLEAVEQAFQLQMDPVVGREEERDTVSWQDSEIRQQPRRRKAITEDLVQQAEVAQTGFALAAAAAAQMP
jgi:hypothetical protein